MEDKQYDIYATDRVNRDLVKGDGMRYLWSDIDPFNSTEELAGYIQDTCEQLVQVDGIDSVLTVQYALLFMRGVNWNEIAEEVAKEYPRVLGTSEEGE